MVAEATLAQLADIDDPINGLGEVGGEWVRDRWNQRATVRVTDHPVDTAATPAYFTNHSMHNVWRLGNSKLGTAIVNEDVDGVDIVIPQ